MAHLTTAQAAASLGLTPGSFRKTMSRARAAGTDLRAPKDRWPDARTPLWDADQLDQWQKCRPRTNG